MTILDTVYETVVKRNPGEVEFHQAVKEVVDSLGPVLKRTSAPGRRTPRTAGGA